VFVGQNLTPDKETGLGNWTTDQIIAAITKGERPDGRQLFTVMPYPELASLTADAATTSVVSVRDKARPRQLHAARGNKRQNLTRRPAVGAMFCCAWKPLASPP
jgi:hypothetical protein